MIDIKFNCFINKSSLKTNACTIKDSAIVKNDVDACTSKNHLVKNHTNACTSKNDLIVKNYADACTNTDISLLKIMLMFLQA